MHKLIVQQRYVEVHEENRLLPKLRDLRLKTDLSTDRCLIVCPDELRPLAETLNKRLVRPLPIRDDAAPSDAHANQILLGNCFNNRAIFNLYRQHLCFVDHGWPGEGGFVAQTIHNPLGDGRNFVLLGGGDAAGVSRACDALASAAAGKAALDGPLNVCASVRNVPLPPADVLVRAEEQLCEHIREGQSAVAVWTAACYGLLGHLGAQPAFVRVFKNVVLAFHARADELGTWQIEPNALIYFILARVLAAWNVIEASQVFDDAERLRITNMLYNLARWVAQLDHFKPEHVASPRGNNHQAFAALSLYLAREYFHRHYGVNEFDRHLPAIDTIMHHHARSWKPNDNGGCIYGWLTPHFLLNYFLRRGLPAAACPQPGRRAAQAGETEYLDNGNLRRLADYAILITDNRGDPVSFGDEAAYRAPTTRREGALQPLAVAAWHYREPKYQWAYQFLQRGVENERSFDFEKPHPLIHWEAFDGAYRCDLSAEPPSDALGLRAALLDQPAYDDLCARHNLSAPKVPREQAFDKISFRRDFDPQSEYLLLGGAGGFSHSHEDVNAILRLTWRDRIWLADLGYPRRLACYHNSVVIVRNGESHSKPVLAALRAHEDHGDTATAETEVPDDNGMRWRRNITWKKGRWFLVVDELEAVEPGDYRVTCYWRVLGEVALRERRLQVTQNGETFSIFNDDGSDLSLCEERPPDCKHWSGGAGDWGNYEHADGGVRVLRQTQRATLKKGERLRFVNVLYMPSILSHTEAVKACLALEGDAPAPPGIAAALTEQPSAECRVPSVECRVQNERSSPTNNSVSQSLSPIACVASHDEQILLGHHDGHARLVDPTGKVLWQHRLDSSITAVHVQPDAFFLGVGNELIAFASVAERQWTHRFNPASVWRSEERPTAITTASLRGDGSKQLLVGTSGRSRLYAFEWDPPAKRRAGGALLWETELLHWAVTALAAADFDGDGKAEIAATTRYGSAYLVGSDGYCRWSRSFGEDATLAAFDLNGDGRVELLVGGQRGVSVWNANGDLLWERNLGGHVLALHCARDGDSVAIVAATGLDELVWLTPQGGRIRTLELEQEVILLMQLRADGILAVTRGGEIVPIEATPQA
ncbi:MAG: hypothetical protein HY360_05275 [Verrucomicrobia bacterium]|nr:hypothetical protein [Verrucomicrobiota bacterium]